jgi:hypothetical protein
MRKTTMAASVTLVALLLISGCGSGGETKKAKPTVDVKVGNETIQIAAGSHDLLLEAEGTGKADVAYGIGDERGQNVGVDLPWRSSTKAEVSGVVSMMVVLPQPGDVLCRITVDGKVLNETKADPGNYSVSCRVG